MTKILQFCFFALLTSVCLADVDNIPRPFLPPLKPSGLTLNPIQQIETNAIENQPPPPRNVGELSKGLTKKLAQITADYVRWFYNMAGRLKVMHIFYAKQEVDNKYRIKMVLEETICKAGTEEKFEINVSCPVKRWGMPLICLAEFLLNPGPVLQTLNNFRCKVQYAD